MEGYLNKREINIDSSKISSTLTDYPVMVKFYKGAESQEVIDWSDSRSFYMGTVAVHNNKNYEAIVDIVLPVSIEPGVAAHWREYWVYKGDDFNFGRVQSDGKDIRFTAADGATVLPYERHQFQQGYPFSLTTSATYEADHIYFYSYGVQLTRAVTLKLFDLTNISEIEIEWELVGGASTSYMALDIEGEDKISYELIKKTGAFAKTTDIIDVSSFTGEKFIRIEVQAVQSFIWCEGAVTKVKLDGVTAYDSGVMGYALPVSGEAIYHVKVPSISSTQDTKIIMWYNNPSETSDGQNVANVWNSNYLAVWHMDNEETINDNIIITDSSGNGNHLTVEGSVASRTFNGQSRVFDGVDDHLFLNSTSLSYPLGVVLVGKIGANADARIMEYAGAGGAMMIAQKGAGDLVLGSGLSFGAYRDTKYVSSLASNEYRDLLSVGFLDVNSYSPVGFNNAYNLLLTDSTTAYADGSVDKLVIGARSDLTAFADIILDEVRLLNSACPVEIQVADYYNLVTWELLSVGVEEEAVNDYVFISNNGVVYAALPYIKISGEWKQAEMYLKVSGVWKTGG